MEYFALFLVVLFLVALVGHWLWLLLTAMFNAVFGIPEETAPASSELAPCPRCGQHQRKRDRLCRRCGEPYQPAKAAEWRDLQVTMRMLAHLQKKGHFDQATLDQLTASISKRRQAILAGHPASPALAQLTKIVAEQRADRATGLAPLEATPSPSEVIPSEAIVDLHPVIKESQSVTTADAILAVLLVDEPAPTSVIAPEPPRVRWREMVQSFLHERNILWGEIVGGLIVIGFSIALVISLWRTLEQIPYFPFFLFVAVTASFFGIGFYTLERWRLQTTSRTFLVIALLMVPLDFLAMASLSKGDTSGLGVRLGGEAMALLLFSFLGLRAARILLPDHPRLVTFALLLISASQLLIPWLLKADAPFPIHPIIVGLVPALAFTGAMGLRLGWLRRDETLTTIHAKELVLFLGLLGFATVAAMGLILFRDFHDEGIGSAARELAVLLTLLALPVTATGMLLHRKLVEPASPYLRIAGTMLALVSVLGQLLTIAVAWLDPLQLLGVGVVNAGSLTLFARRFLLPYLHALALGCLALSVLTGFHIATGDFLERTAFMEFLLPINGMVLACVALVLSILAEGWMRSDRAADGAAYALGSLALGTLALLLLAQPTADKNLHALVQGVFAVAALGSTLRWRLPALTYLGLALFIGAMLLLLPETRFGSPLWLHTRIPVLLGSATLGFLLGRLLERSWTDHANIRRGYIEPLYSWAICCSLAAVPWFLAGLGGRALPFLAWAGAWQTALWLALAGRFRNVGWLRAAQIMFFVAVGYGVTDWLLVQHWVAGEPQGLVEYRSLQTYGIAWAMVCLGWAAVRRSRLWRDINYRRPSVEMPDRLVFALLITFLVGMVTVALFPAWQWELYDPGRVAITPQAFGPAAWLFFGMCLAVLLLDLWTCWTAYHLHLLLLLLLAVPLLIAGPFAAEQAAVPATLWTLALMFQIGSAVLWWRRSWRRWAKPLRCQIELPRSWPHDAYAHWALMTALPVTLATLGLFRAVFTEGPGIGPAVGTMFDRLGPTGNAVIPLVLVILGLIGQAWRERSHGWAFLAGMLTQVAVLCGYVYHLTHIGQRIEELETYRLLQLFTISAAVWTLGWIGLVWLRRRLNLLQEMSNAFLSFQVHLAVTGCVLLLTYVSILLFVRPEGPGELVRFAGGLANWMALVLTFATVGLSKWFTKHRDHGLVIACGGAALTVVAACVLASWDTSGQWIAYHALLAGWTLTVWATWLVMGRESHRLPWFLWCLLGFVVVLGVRGLFNDPQQPSWSMSSFLALCIFTAVVARQLRLPGFAFLSALLTSLAMLAVYLALPAKPMYHLVHFLALGGATFALVWALATRFLRPHDLPPTLHIPAVTVATFALIAEAVLMAVAWSVALDGGFEPMAIGHVLGWATLVTLSAAWAALWYWTGARRGAMALYGMGLLLLALALHEGGFTPVHLLWMSGLALSGYVLLLSVLTWVSCRRERRPLPEWFLAAQLFFSSVAFLLSLWMTHAFTSVPERLGGSAATLLLGVAAGLFRYTLAPGPNRDLCQRLTVFFALVTAQLLVWAFLDPNDAMYWLNVTVALVVLTAVAAWAALLVPARLGEWTTQVRRMGLVLGLLSLVAVVLALVQEFLFFQPALNKVPLSFITVGLMLAALLGLLGLLLRCAALPAQGSWQLSERWRHGCVYLAEIVLVLFFCHLRLTLPEVFPRETGRYWMFIVMGISFVGVGLADFFQRLRFSVISQPLARTGLFLPLLPLIAFWLKPSNGVRDALRGILIEVLPGGLPFLRYLENLPDRFDWYGLLLFLAGAVYGLVALTRRSIGFALIAVLAANFGLWSLLQDYGVRFTLHPQAWLVPLAIILLVTERLHRGRLTEVQSTGLRYAALMMLYVASTADMFITGIGQSVVLPLVLAVLAVVGILLGIFFRVKAYLFLGVAFLLVDLGSLVWHAAFDRHQMWVLWACGVALGVLVLALFAYFEKHRQRVLFALDDLRIWE